MYCGTLMKKNQQHLLRHIGKRPMKAITRESKLFSGLLSLFPTSISACSEIGTLCRPLEGNNTGLNCVQLWTKEMEMKGIVTNKKERDRKAWISYYDTCFAVFSVVKSRTPTAVIIAIFEFGNTFSFVYARIVDAGTLFPQSKRKVTLSSQIKKPFDNNQNITHFQDLLGPLSQE